jgi:hypothetical protein
MEVLFDVSTLQNNNIIRSILENVMEGRQEELTPEKNSSSNDLGFWWTRWY